MRAESLVLLRKADADVVAALQAMGDGALDRPERARMVAARLAILGVLDAEDPRGPEAWCRAWWERANATTAGGFPIRIPGGFGPGEEHGPKYPGPNWSIPANDDLARGCH